MIFSIGSLGSKLIVFLLVPFYTYVMSSSEYGTVDLITTITTMLLPVFSFSIYESVLRFTMDDIENRKYLDSALSLVVYSTVITLPIILILSFVMSDNIYILIWLILVMQGIQSIMLQYIRAIGLVKLYSLNGIVMTLVLVGCNLILLLELDLGIEGYLYSIIISNVFSILFITLIAKIKFPKNLLVLNKKYLSPMLKYSFPLIPNSLMWWIMNASSRLFIVYFISSSANGIFAVSTKIPGIINIFYSIFLQAWQLSAIEEYKDKNKALAFYNDIYNYLIIFLCIVTSVLIIIIKPLMAILVSEEYYSSGMYIPILLLATVFSSLSGFIGTIYTATKKTSGVFYSSVVGGVISIGLNLLLIPRLGLIGAAVSQVISFFSILIYRKIETRKTFEIKMNRRTYCVVFFLVLQIISTYILKINSWNYVFQIACLCFILVLSLQEIYIKLKKE